MLHTKYQGSIGLAASDKKIFSGLPYISLCETCDPGEGHFWSKWNNLDKHGRGPLGDDTYKISRFYALWFQTRRFFNVFPI